MQIIRLEITSSTHMSQNQAILQEMDPLQYGFMMS